MPESSVRRPLRDRSPTARALRALRHWLDQGTLAAGERLPAEGPLASQLGVSRTSLRRALDHLVAEGAIVPDEAGRRRVAPTLAEAQRLAQRTVGVLGYGLRGLRLNGLAQGYDVHVLLALIQALEGRDCHVLMCAPKTDIGSLGRAQVDQLAGVIATATGLRQVNAPAFLSEMAREGLAVVVQDDGNVMPQFDSVRSDHEAGGWLLADWLLRRGARRLVCLWEIDTGDTLPHWLLQREHGVQRAKREHGHGHVAIAVVEHPPDPHSMNGFRHRTQRLCQQHATLLRQADAILATSDGQAYHITAALTALGRRPGHDVLVCGYDHYWQDSVYHHTNGGPALTIDKQASLLADGLATLLNDRLAGHLSAEPQHRAVAPRLVVREDQIGRYLVSDESD